MNAEQPHPTRYEVVIRVTDPATGAALVRKAHECSGLAEARTLLTNLREMAEELSAYLPGLSVEGYECGETPAAPENPILAAVAGWLPK